MVISSAAVSLIVLSLFAMAWMAMRERVTRRDGTKPYHIGLYQQDRRKGLFYYRSVWTGLIASFVALACLQVIANTLMAASNTRNFISGTAYGLGIWGLLIVGLVWSQIGHRAIEFNSDGKSLTPLPHEKETKKTEEKR